MRTVRPLTREEHEAFRVARLVAAEQAPYFLHVLFAVAPVAAPGLGTMAVDAQWRLYLDPAVLVGEMRWTPAVLAAGLAHEAGHLLRDHAGRADALPIPRYHEAWNIAGDAEINDDLVASGIPLPEWAITPAAIGCADGDLAETYYAHLTGDPATPAPDGGDDEPGCGSGAGCPPVPGELPAGVALPDGTAEPISPAEGDLVRRRVARAIQEHEQGKGRGTVPGGLTRWAATVLAPPTVPWERLLRAAIRRAVADRAGRVDYTYSRPSRRTVPGIVKPSMRGPSLRVSIVVDTSGSMSQADLAAAMAEVHGVLHAGGVAREHIRLLSCDAATTTAQRVRSATRVVLTGGGGTDMRVGIAAATATRPEPHIIIVLTDGDTPWPDTPTRARLVCAVIASHPPTGTPPWATTVHVPPAAA